MIKKKIKWEKHIVKEGARYHVLYWDCYGARCSEPNCEINSNREDRMQKYRKKVTAKK